MRPPRLFSQLAVRLRLLQTRRATPSSAFAPPERNQAQRWASSKPPPPPPSSRNSRRDGRSKEQASAKADAHEAVDPFQGQLIMSTRARVQREKAEHRRWAQMPKNRYEGDEGVTWSHVIHPLGWGVSVTLFLWFGYRMGYYSNHEISSSSTVPLEDAQKLKLDAAEHTMQTAWTLMRDIVGKENISTKLDDRLAHAGSHWSSYERKDDERPFMVVRPGSTEEVSEIMKACHKRRIPVTPYSGGTSLEGHYAPTHGGICVDFSRMNRIVRLDADDLDVVVQPAVGWEQLNDYLADYNLFFPPDPGPGAMIGGMVGTGCSGTNAYRYGTMRDWVLSLTVVLADGTVIKTRQRPRKSSAGYDLTRTFIGSEGTLGLVTEAVLKVTTKPANTSVAVCSFPSIKHAADCASRIVKAGVPVAAVEILDDVQMKCVNDANASGSKKWAEAPTLFFKFAGTATSVKEDIGIVKGLARKAGSKRFEFAENAEHAEELWSARRAALWSVMAKRREGDRVWTTDVAVPISRLPECIEETKKDMVESGLFGSIVGHVGDGNFHAIILFNKTEQALVEDVVHRMVKRAIEMDGTATGEHGVGLVKRDYLPHELGETTVDLMRKMKEAFDPLCILNCGKVMRMQAPATGELKAW